MNELPHKWLILIPFWLVPVALQSVPVAQNSLLSPVIAEIRVLGVESEIPYNLAFISEPPELLILPESIYCECVKTARLFNENIPFLNAKDFQPNITRREVRVGDFILENFNGVAHIAYIGDLQIQGYILKEGNYKKCKYTEGRIVPYDSENVKGFYRP